MKMSSKGQGLSLNTVIIAALVLVVLLILLGITTGYFGKWTDDFKKLSETSCAGNGGKVVSESEVCNSPYKDSISVAYDDVNPDQKCCLKDKEATQPI